MPMMLPRHSGVSRILDKSHQPRKLEGEFHTQFLKALNHQVEPCEHAFHIFLEITLAFEHETAKDLLQLLLRICGKMFVHQKEKLFDAIGALVGVGVLDFDDFPRLARESSNEVADSTLECLFSVRFQTHPPPFHWFLVVPVLAPASAEGGTPRMASPCPVPGA